MQKYARLFYSVLFIGVILSAFACGTENTSSNDSLEPGGNSEVTSTTATAATMCGDLTCYNFSRCSTEDWQAQCECAAGYAGETCADRISPCAKLGGLELKEVRGRVLGSNKQPKDRAYLSFCVEAAFCMEASSAGCSRCLSSQAGTDGTFRVPVPADFQCMRRGVLRVSGVGATATMYQDATFSNDDYSLSYDTVFTLFDTVAATSLVAPTVENKETVQNVKFDNGFELEMAPSKYFEGSDLFSKLALVELEGEARNEAQFVENPLDYEAFYGVFPESNVKDAGAKIILPNSTNLNAGTQVEVYVLPGIYCLANAVDDQTPQKYSEGEWTMVGTGTVAANAQSIALDAGATTPCIGWFGYKKK
ncbi:MAG: hypothetical protein VYA34_06665 [Myxococcota bacterium]|nr:hypothetical protein [Myxococcota bacterium]